MEERWRIHRKNKSMEAKGRKERERQAIMYSYPLHMHLDTQILHLIHIRHTICTHRKAYACTHVHAHKSPTPHTEA